MKLLLLSALAFAATCSSVANAQAANSGELGPELREKISAYQSCLKATDDQLRSNRVTPERYQMAIQGACMLHYDAVTAGMRAHLEAIPHPYVSYDDAQAVTANTMASIGLADERRRKQFASNYVLWYSSSKP